MEIALESLSKALPSRIEWIKTFRERVDIKLHSIEKKLSKLRTEFVDYAKKEDELYELMDNQSVFTPHNGVDGFLNKLQIERDKIIAMFEPTI